ncbi:hypothetical protein [Phytopseudomonas punonensis]|uniref:Uncharacterized protein n=1 Tax=Phytopseudomonas punonensis TaxID=1220495 RepID=A0A1M7LEV3_9GAMM|nr:hypothetical protein [Pseudomonas punonensis]SHM76442.1 hypothetical protein SAMN05216288_4238 [Pseudomonas punonensis]
MNFVNNWFQVVALPLGATTLALDLEDGDYQFTLTDDAAAATRWEIVTAEVLSGNATLVRGQEGTVAQSWPAGSVIYNSVTAGTLNTIDSRLAALESGGTGAIVGDALPGAQDIPTAVGALYAVPGTGVWVSMGTEHGSDWARLVGSYYQNAYQYPAGTPGTSFTAEYDQRNFGVSVSDAYIGAYPATLVMPWVGMPYGLEIHITPALADSIALSMDFTAMGEQAYVQIENSGVDGVELSVSGGIVTVTVAEACTLKLVSHWREGNEFGVDFQLVPITPSTIISYPE